MVPRRQLAVGLAHPVAGAVVGAGRSLAGGPLVAGEAGARRGRSVAEALVGALHVEMSGVGDGGPVRLLFASVRVRVRVSVGFSIGVSV